MGNKQLVNRKETLKPTVLSQPKAKESTWNMLAFLGLRLRYQCQFLSLDFLLKHFLRRN